MMMNNTNKIYNINNISKNNIIIYKHDEHVEDGTAYQHELQMSVVSYDKDET